MIYLSRRAPVTPPKGFKPRHLGVIRSCDLVTVEQPRPARNWLLVTVLSALAVGAVVLAAYLGAMP